jgi:hypothetical protein
MCIFYIMDAKRRKKKKRCCRRRLCRRVDSLSLVGGGYDRTCSNDGVCCGYKPPYTSIEKKKRIVEREQFFLSISLSLSLSLFEVFALLRVMYVKKKRILTRRFCLLLSLLLFLLPLTIFSSGHQTASSFQQVKQEKKKQGRIERTHTRTHTHK